MSAVSADASAVLRAWRAPSPAQERLRSDYLALLEAHEDAMWRSCRVGHLTASTLVVDADLRRVLLTLHPKAGRWLQLGGHCEPSDGSLAEAALREAREEGGIDGLTLVPDPQWLSRHPVRCTAPDGQSGPSVHYDVEYVAVAPSGTRERISEESLDLRWFPVDALPADADADVRALVERAMLALNGAGTAPPRTESPSGSTGAGVAPEPRVTP